MGETLRLMYGTFKVRIGLAITLCAIAGMAIAPGEAPPAWQIWLLAFAVLMSSASAGALNQLVERDLDARMARTRDRPFVTGRLQPSATWTVTIVLLILVPVTALAIAVSPAAAAYVFLGAFVYGIVYTIWLKRRTWTNIVFGGLAGSFAVLAGSAVIDPALAPAPIILAVVLFLWTPPHFWSLAIVYRDDYAAAGVPMLPVVAGDDTAAKVILLHTVALVGLSLTPIFFGAGWIYFAGAAVGGVYFVRTSVGLVRAPGRAAALKNFHASLMQLGVLLVATIVDAAVLA